MDSVWDQHRELGTIMFRMVDPSEILPYLTSLSDPSKSEIQARTRQEGINHGAFLLTQHLKRRGNSGFHDLMQALKKAERFDVIEVIQNVVEPVSQSRDESTDNQSARSGIHRQQTGESRSGRASDHHPPPLMLQPASSSHTQPVNTPQTPVVNIININRDPASAPAAVTTQETEDAGYGMDAALAPPVSAQEHLQENISWKNATENDERTPVETMTSDDSSVTSAPVEGATIQPSPPATDTAGNSNKPNHQPKYVFRSDEDSDASVDVSDLLGRMESIKSDQPRMEELKLGLSEPVEESSETVPKQIIPSAAEECQPTQEVVADPTLMESDDSHECCSSCVSTESDDDEVSSSDVQSANTMVAPDYREKCKKMPSPFQTLEGSPNQSISVMNDVPQRDELPGAFANDTSAGNTLNNSAVIGGDHNISKEMNVSNSLEDSNDDGQQSSEQTNNDVQQFHLAYSEKINQSAKLEQCFNEITECDKDSEEFRISSDRQSEKHSTKIHTRIPNQEQLTHENKQLNGENFEKYQSSSDEKKDFLENLEYDKVQNDVSKPKLFANHSKAIGAGDVSKSGMVKKMPLPADVDSIPSNASVVQNKNHEESAENEFCSLTPGVTTDVKHLYSDDEHKQDRERPGLKHENKTSPELRNGDKDPRDDEMITKKGSTDENSNASLLTRDNYRNLKISGILLIMVILGITVHRYR